MLANFKRVQVYVEGEGVDVRDVASTSWTNLVTDVREGSASW